ncbi:MAG: hypothetical protein OSB00_10235 [Sphingomonas bacterium]|nr:hypothetical protein [Sphingomonas bacterium]
MMKPLMLAAALGAVAACAQTPAQTARAAQDAAAAQDALAKELAGLVPKGELTCLPTFPTKSVRSYGQSLVYVAGPRLKYVSRTAGGCEGVARNDILVTVSNGGRTCQGDISRTIDRTARFPTGGCALGPFTEYRRP